MQLMEKTYRALGILWKMRHLMNGLAAFIVAVALATVVSCDNSQRKSASETAQKSEDAVAALAKRHGAIVGWEAALPRRDASGSPFTADVSKALVTTNGQTALFSDAYLFDLVEKDGKTTAYFDAAFRGPNFLALVLSCAPEQAAQLSTTNVSYGSAFAVVARIAEVSRPRRVSTAGESYETEVDYGSASLYARGTCVDFLRLVEAPRSRASTPH